MRVTLTMPFDVLGTLPEPVDVPTPAVTDFQLNAKEQRVLDLQAYASTPDGRAAIEAELASRLRRESKQDMSFFGTATAPGTPRRKRRAQSRAILKNLTKAKRAKNG